MYFLLNNRKRLGLIALLLCAFLARGYTLNFPLYHWDENLDINNVFSASFNNLDLLNYGHGSLQTYLILVVWYLYLVVHGIQPNTVNLLDMFFQNPTPLLIMARGLIALISTASIALTFLLAKRLYNPVTGWISAIMLSGAFLYAAESHYLSSVHVLSTFFVIAGLYYFHNILTVGNPKDYIAGGVCFGLAVASQYSMVIVVAPLLYAHIKRIQKTQSKIPWLTIFMERSLLISAACAALAFFIATPYAVLESERFFGAMQSILKNVSNVWVDTHGQPVWLFFLTEHLRNGIGNGLTFLSMAGFLYALYRRSESDLLLLSFIVISYLSLAGGANFARYLIPSLPCILILAARLFNEIFSRLEKHISRMMAIALQVFALVLLLLQPVIRIISYNYWLTQTDTRELAKQWIMANIPSDAKFAIEGAGPLSPSLPIALQDRQALLAIQTDGSLGDVYTQALIQSQPEKIGYTSYYVFRLDQRHQGGVLIGYIEDAFTYKELGYEYLITSSWMQRLSTDTYSAEFLASLNHYYEPIMSFEPNPYFRYDPYAWRMDYQALDQVVPGEAGISGPRLTIYKLRETE